MRTVSSCCPSGNKGYYEVEILERVDGARFGFATQGHELLLARTDEGVGDDLCTFGVGEGRIFQRGCCHEVSVGVMSREWQAGDVIGLACDPSEAVWHISVNGEWASTMEIDAEARFQSQPPDQSSHSCFLTLAGDCKAAWYCIVGCCGDPRISSFRSLPQGSEGRTPRISTGRETLPSWLISRVPSKVLLYPALTCTSGKVRCNLGERPFRHAPPDSQYKAFAELAAHTGSTPGVFGSIFSGLISCQPRLLSQSQLNMPESELSRLDQARVVLHRGVVGSCCVDPEKRAVSFEDFSSVLSLTSCPVGSKAYYELTVVRLGARPQFGFASAGFNAAEGETNQGVGDDASSWGVDGRRMKKWHAGESSYPCKWHPGDVVGLACDLVSGKIHVSVNGYYGWRNGLMFDLNVEECGDLFPSFTGSEGTEVRYNFGEQPFRHSPPRGGGFKSLIELQEDQDTQASLAEGERVPLC